MYSPPYSDSRFFLARFDILFRLFPNNSRKTFVAAMAKEFLSQGGNFQESSPCVSAWAWVMEMDWIPTAAHQAAVVTVRDLLASGDGRTRRKPWRGKTNGYRDSEERREDWITFIISQASALLGYKMLHPCLDGSSKSSYPKETKSRCRVAHAGARLDWCITSWLVSPYSSPSTTFTLQSHRLPLLDPKCISPF